MLTFGGESQPQETIRTSRRLGLAHFSRLSEPSFRVTRTYERILHFLRTGVLTGEVPYGSW